MKIGKLRVKIPPMLKGNRVIPPDSLYNRSNVKKEAKKEIEEVEKDSQMEKEDFEQRIEWTI